MKRRKSQKERRLPKTGLIVHTRCSPKIRSMQQAADGEIIEKRVWHGVPDAESPKECC
ncbi:hypothetical protein [Ruegeria sp.]|uniref:hypothetical protein n=1 Tax=Ruegeria sp. TaxID=1879320 RepID=UPI003B00110C